MIRPRLIPRLLLVAALLSSCFSSSAGQPGEAGLSPEWILIDDFEAHDPLQRWHLRDTDNRTNPIIEKPQVTEVVYDETSGNHFLSKKPAADGIVGNRKALSFLKLPKPVDVGETYTFYTRINVEYFPNNHVFGLSNLGPDGIEAHDYDALEPSLRVTDKRESDGYRNDGTLMVRLGKDYEKIRNVAKDRPARPLRPDTWYEIWFVVDNRRADDGGQRYDVYVRGGDEFQSQQIAFAEADFRMARELPLAYFVANCNTGPPESPYGNGALRFDDLYMAMGRVLTAPISKALR